MKSNIHKKIGYIEFIVLRKTPIEIINNILYLICDSNGKIIYNQKIIIPPILLNIKSEMYNTNVNIIKEILCKL